VCIKALELRASRVASEKEAYRNWPGRHSVSDMPYHPLGMRLVVLASILLLAGCAMPSATVQPAMDYPPGAFYGRDGTPKVLPCMAGALLCSPRGG